MMLRPRRRLVISVATRLRLASGVSQRGSAFYHGTLGEIARYPELVDDSLSGDGYERARLRFALDFPELIEAGDLERLESLVLRRLSGFTQ